MWNLVGVMGLKSCHIAQTQHLTRQRVGEHHQLVEVIQIAIRYRHMH